MKTICIIGGGISGLTSAHELNKLGYNIIVLERNDIVGGLARTKQNQKDKICPIEYSWRAYGKWYQNVYNVMKEIKINYKETVYDNLVELQGGVKTCNKKIPSYQDTLIKIPLKDKIKLLPSIFNYFISSKKQNIDNYSHISLKKFIKFKKLNNYTENLIGKIVGPYLGFDYQNASLYDLYYFFEMYHANSDDSFNFSITKYPTNYAWFDPWIKQLKSRGVKIYNNVIVNHIIIENNNVIAILLNNNNFIKCDYVINCTGPEIYKKLLNPYKNIYKNYYNKISNVAKFGYQIQLSIYYYLNLKIFLNNKNTLAYLPKTPWLLMILPTGHIWGDEFLNKYCDKNIKEVISVGICEPYVKGNFIKKKWSDCNKEEIRIEAWHQLINDNDFINNICIGNKVTNTISDVKILDFKMWSSYKYKNGMTTYEPKWGNNVNTAKYRPKAITPINNLFLAGSYTDTTTGVYSMESACESGKEAAIKLCEIDKKPNNIYIHKKKTLLLSQPFRYINSNLKIFVLIVIFLIIILIVYKILL